jgi:hypothetical protein
MERLEQTLEYVMSGYAKKGLNVRDYLTISPDRSIFSIVGISRQQGKRYADASLIVRLDGAQIIIELDMNDKPLVDALVQAGVPREKITLAYAGEPVPEALEVI